MIGAIKKKIREKREHLSTLREQASALEKLADKGTYYALSEDNQIAAFRTVFSTLSASDLESAISSAAEERAWNLAYKMNNLMSRAPMHEAVFSDFGYSVGEHILMAARRNNVYLKRKRHYSKLFHEGARRINIYINEETVDNFDRNETRRERKKETYQKRWVPAIGSLAHDMWENDREKTVRSTHEVRADLSPEAEERFVKETTQYLMEVFLPLDSYHDLSTEEKREALAPVIEHMDQTSLEAEMSQVVSKVMSCASSWTRFEKFVHHASEALASDVGVEDLGLRVVDQNTYSQALLLDRLSSYLRDRLHDDKAEIATLVREAHEGNEESYDILCRKIDGALGV